MKSTWQEQFLDYLIHDHVKRGGGELSENSLKANLQDVRHFAKFAGGSFHPRQMDAELVKRYFAWQDQIKAAARSRNRRLASLRNLVKFCLAAGWLDVDPTSRIRRVEYEAQVPHDINADDRRKLERVVENKSHLRCNTERYGLYGLRDKVIFGLMNDAGLRIHEVVGLNVSDLRSRKMIHVCGKGKRHGFVKVKQALFDDIQAWLDWRPAPMQEGADEPLITDLDGNRITTGQVRRRFKQIAKTAGVEANPHDLRHTFIYRTYDEAKKMGLLDPIAMDFTRRQARHSDERTTRSYMRVRESEMDLLVEAM